MEGAEIIPATKKHRRVLRALFELYEHDFSPMTGQDVNAHGEFTVENFPLDWWEEHGDAFHPFLLTMDGKWAGFAFVGEGSYTQSGETRHWLMEEFFVLRKYRGQGVGAWFAMQLFDRFPGAWEVGEIHANTNAQRFWRKVIGRYAGEFEEIVVGNDRWDGPVQRFRSSSD
jgi:predicted acetyltransferase